MPNSTMNLTKQIIHKQVEELSKQFYPEEKDIPKGLSSAYSILAISKILDIDLDVAFDAVTDGKGDLKIDGLYFTEPNDGKFPVALFQSKYSTHFEKDGGFKENDIIGIISTLRNIFGNIHEFQLNEKLEHKLNEVHSYIAMGDIPMVTVYLINNGKKWESNGQKYIDSFLNESPMNRELFEFIYVNHEDLLAFFHKDKKVNCMLNFTGKFIDEELNFKRALIGTVPVKNIAEVMEQHHHAILKQNVRDFLGTKGINQNIKETLEDPESRKNFYFLNNGITIICSNVGYAPSTKSDNTILKLTHAQIINGGQTSKTIQMVLNQKEQSDEDFSQASVLVRIYRIDEENEDDLELIDKITLATNSQNAIRLNDLRANDKIQKRIEVGLAKHGYTYLRRRSDKRAKKGDIRKEIVAQVILSAILKKPNEAKYKKALHFGLLYHKIFDEKIITVETIIVLVRMYTLIENKRKSLMSQDDLLVQFPFVPYASDHLLMLTYEFSKKDLMEIQRNDMQQILNILENMFADWYSMALQGLKGMMLNINIDLNHSLEMIGALKSQRLNGDVGININR